jgi:hypothetical protein
VEEKEKKQKKDAENLQKEQIEKEKHVLKIDVS